ncbi:MAG: RNA 2',3'-cyclic phosphodiesterase [Kangiellaceae bacterium]
MGKNFKKKKSPIQNQERLFFAIDLDLNTKTELISVSDRFQNPLYKNINPSNFHITLSYLGPLTNKKMEMILDNFVAPPNKNFVCSTSSLIYLRSANMMALKIDDEEQNLIKLKRQIEKQVNRISPLNLSKNEFIPHISLFKNVESVPISFENFTLANEIRISVSHFSLMRSNLTSSSVSYEIVKEWELISQNSGRSIKEQLLGIAN